MLLKRENLQGKIDYLRKRVDYLVKQNEKLARENDFLLENLASLKVQKEEFKKAWKIWIAYGNNANFWTGFKSSMLDTAVRKLLR